MFKGRISGMDVAIEVVSLSPTKAAPLKSIEALSQEVNGCLQLYHVCHGMVHLLGLSHLGRLPCL